MRLLVVVASLGLLLAQAQQPPSLERQPDLSAFESFLPQAPPGLKPPPKTSAIRGRVVLYNSWLMDQSAQMDLFIKVDGTDEFLRVAYTPYNGGFDAPAPTPEMIPPREMTRNGRARWMFQIYPSGTDSENRICASLQQKGVPDGSGHYVSSEYLEAYLPVPGAKGGVPSDLHTVSCRYVKAWARIDDPPLPERPH